MDHIPPELYYHLLEATADTSLHTLLSLRSANRAFNSLFQRNTHRLLHRFARAFIGSPETFTACRILAALPDIEWTHEKVPGCTSVNDWDLREAGGGEKVAAGFLERVGSGAWVSSEPTVEELRGMIKLHGMVRYLGNCIAIRKLARRHKFIPFDYAVRRPGTPGTLDTADINLLYGDFISNHLLFEGREFPASRSVAAHLGYDWLPKRPGPDQRMFKPLVTTIEQYLICGMDYDAGTQRNYIRQHAQEGEDVEMPYSAWLYVNQAGVRNVYRLCEMEDGMGRVEMFVSIYRTEYVRFIWPSGSEPRTVPDRKDEALTLF